MHYICIDCTVISVSLAEANIFRGKNSKKRDKNSSCFRTLETLLLQTDFSKWSEMTSKFRSIELSFREPG